MSAHRPETSCPRCGYDQSGVIEAWGESCPLTGKCSECGLEYDWAEVLNPRKRTPKWYVEPSGRFIASYLATIARAVFPPSLWTRVPLGALYNPRRLVAAVILSLGIVHALLLALVLMAEYCPWYDGEAHYVVQHAGPPAFAGGKWTWKEETVPENLLFATLHPPIAIGQYVMWESRLEYTHLLTPLQLIAFALPIVMPVCFALLPESLRRSRVRARHLFRAGAVCACVCALYFGASQLTAGVLATRDVYIEKYMALFFDGPPLILWSVWYWWSTVRFYLRIPHALAVSVLLHAIVCILLLMTPPISQYLMRNFILTGY